MQGASTQTCCSRISGQTRQDPTKHHSAEFLYAARSMVLCDHSSKCLMHFWSYKTSSYSNYVQKTALCHLSCIGRMGFYWLVNKYVVCAHFGHFCRRNCQGESLGLRDSPAGAVTNTLKHSVGVCTTGAAWGVRDWLKFPPELVICFAGKTLGCFQPTKSVQHLKPLQVLTTDD